MQRSGSGLIHQNISTFCSEAEENRIKSQLLRFEQGVRCSFRGSVFSLPLTSSELLILLNYIVIILPYK
jgi:hypothetical protein